MCLDRSRAPARFGKQKKKGEEERGSSSPLSGLESKTPPDVRGGGRAGSADLVYCQRRSLHPRPKLPPAAPRQTQTEIGVKPAIEHWHTFTGAGFLRSVQINILTFLVVLPACRHEATPTRCPRGETGYRRKDQGLFFETPFPLPPRRRPRV